ncbi:MAG: cation transporter [Pseudomonadota bacterium]
MTSSAAHADRQGPGHRPEHHHEHGAAQGHAPACASDTVCSARPAAAASGCCDHDHVPTDATQRYRRALWIALWLNAAMFVVEMIGGLGAQSSSLLADAADFAGDAANYGLGLFALSMGAVWRSRTAWFKGATMLLYGIAVLAVTGWRAWSGVLPEPATMGVIGTLALATNVGVAMLLYAFRDGDAQMRSVWLCTRNDAIGNVAVLLAAAGVFGVGQAWPDLLVAGFMSVLAIHAGASVMGHARHELRTAAAPA